MTPELQRAIARMQRTIVQLAVGIDAPDIARCGRVTGRLSIPHGMPQWTDPKPAPDADACEWVVGYCSNAIVQIEERAGDLATLANDLASGLSARQ